MRSIIRRTGWLVAGVVLGATSCARDAVSPYDQGRAAAPQDVAATTDNVAIQWDNAALQAIRVAKLGPPIVARALAIVHTAMYDAWAAYDDRAVGTRLGGSLRRPGVERTLANKNEAVSFAAYRALVDLFPTQTPLVQRRHGEPRLRSSQRLDRRRNAGRRRERGGGRRDRVPPR